MSSQLEMNAYYALGVPAYVVLMAIEHALARRQGRTGYGFAVTTGNFAGGLGEVVVGLFLGPYLIALYDFGFEHIRLVRWPEGSWIPWVLAFLAGDLCYYWYHRAGHRVAALWAIHGVHHQAEVFDLSVAIRNPWFSDVYSAIFYVPLPLLGVPTGHFFVAISVISFYAVSVHTQVFHRRGFFVLVTPATHIVHHAANKPYRDKNFGAMFTLWDRLFGTHAEVTPAEPLRLGSPSGYETHDGALAQLVAFRHLFRLARQARTLGDAVRTFVMPPGWRPPGAGPREPIAPPRPDEEIPLGTKVFVGVHLTVTIVFALYVLWFRDEHPFWVHLAGSAVVLFALGTLGGLVDGRRAAVPADLARLAAMAALGGALATQGYAIAGPALVVAGLGGAAWLLGASPTRPPVRLPVAAPSS